VIFYNFRADRARQITRAFTEEGFTGFPRERPKLSSYVCMTEYDETFGLPVAFPSLSLENIFPELISRAGLKQLRIAETEKYAHVTFFFNGGEEKEFPGEERILIPSPRTVSTYDQKPEMSAYLVTEEVVRQIEKDRFDVIILNFANGDMVGHTGIFEAAVRAVESVDACIGKISEVLQKKGGTLIITSDHGNCEMMRDPKDGEAYTAHTINPVPLIVARKGLRLRKRGILADVAPTMLDLLGLPQPKEMTGRSLIL
jgi:2,3-bisphosphoglycerate-independent phosphoglycerate mutase